MSILIRILPLVGVLLGWGLARLTKYFDIYYADKRILKETLYFLLELFGQLTTVKNVEDCSNIYLEEITKSCPDLIIDQRDFEQARQMLKKMLTDFNNPRVETELYDLTKNYEECLFKLAAVDPINAYRLRGKNKIISYLDQWNNFVSKTILMDPAIKSDLHAKQFNDALKPRLETGLIKETLNELKEIINSISAKIGGKTSKESKKLIILSTPESKIDIESEMKKRVEEIILPEIRRIITVNSGEVDP